MSINPQVSSYKRFFDYDPLTGRTEYFHETDDGGFAISSVEDVEPIIERNKALKGGNGRQHWTGDWRLCASIPASILLKWATEDGIPPTKVFSDEFAERIQRRLKDPDYRHFMCADVRL